MITVTIDEDVLAARVAESLVGVDAYHLNVMRNDLMRMQRNFQEATEGGGSLNNYTAEHAGGGISPLSTPLGSVRAIRMAGPIGVMQMENGDSMVYDGGLIFNHSLHMRVTLAEIDKALENLA